MSLEISGLVLSPLYILWYNFLDKKVPGTTGRSLIKKIALDQIAAGMFGTCIFFIGTVVFVIINPLTLPFF